MGNKFYYRDEDTGAAWKVADESEFEKIKQTCAFHVSTHFLTSEITGNKDEDSKIRYKGDLWLDIDYKTVEFGSQSLAIEKALEEARAIAKYLYVSDVSLDMCGIYLSGGKGVHIRIPLKVMGGVALKDLPLVHREMAKMFIAKTGAEGIDLQIYRMQKGGLIRVENKPRHKDGNYKVQITWAELDKLDAEAYFKYVKEPRLVFPLAKPVVNKVLSSMFNESLHELESLNAYNKSTATKVEYFEAVGNEPVKCWQRLVKFEGVKDIPGRFNKAKISHARFMLLANYSDAVKNQMNEEFIENFHSDSCPTSRAKRMAVDSAIRWVKGQSHPFSCGYVRELLDGSPCHGCPVQSAKLAEEGENYLVEEINGCYYKKPYGKRTEPLQLSDFVLSPTQVSYEVADDGTLENRTFTYTIHHQSSSTRDGICIIRGEDFLSRSKFLNAMKNHTQATWRGRDEDVLELRKYVTSDDFLLDVERVIPVKKQGINKVIDTERNIEEYVWVQKGWSWNGIIKDTVRFQGPRQIGDSGEQTTFTLNLKEVAMAETTESVRILKALFGSRGKKEVSVLFAWVTSCWLKPFIQSGEYEVVFPILHVYGIAGSGKTELSKAFSMLAGNDSANSQTINVSNCSAYFLKALACSTTTIPQIFDEVNVTKMKNEEIHRAVREVVKSTGTRQLMGKGRVIGSGDSGQVATETTICSSPLIMLSTAQNQEQEIIQRSIILYLNKDDITVNTDISYRTNFKEVIKHREAMLPYVRMLMEGAVRIKPEEIQELWKQTDWLGDGIKDSRLSAMVRKLGMGLLFAISAFTTAKCSPEIIAMIEDFYNTGLKEYLADPRCSYLFSDGRTETDIAMDLIISMAQLDDHMGSSVLKAGTHFITENTVIHLKLNSIYMHFMRLAKELSWMVEYSSSKALVQALENCSYYLGCGKARGVAAPMEWHTFCIQGLSDKNIDVTRLNQN